MLFNLIYAAVGMLVGMLIKHFMLISFGCSMLGLWSAYLNKVKIKDHYKFIKLTYEILSYEKS